MENRTKITYQILTPSTGDFTSTLCRCSLEEHVKYCLRAAILTTRGERPLYPTVGSRLRDLLFRPLTMSTKSEIRDQVRAAIESAEPRVNQLDVDVTASATDRSQLQIFLKYQIRETQKQDQLRLALAP